MPRFAIRNPYFILVVCVAILVLGITSIVRMPVELFPSINLPVVVVATFYNGMPPEEIESEITSRFERFFTLGAGIDHIESRSLLGVSVIKIYFQPGTNADADVTMISNLAMAQLRRLPPGTLPPVVIKFDASSLPVCLITLKGEGMSEAQLRDTGQFSVRNQLAVVKGASVPPPFGGKYRQIMVYVDPVKLQAYQLSVMDVVRSINDANLILPAGDAKIGPYDYSIYTNSQIRNIDDINRVPLKNDGQRLVTVSDVGWAADANQIQANLVRVDGQRSVFLPILKQGGDTNTIAVVDGIKSVVSRLFDVPKELVTRVVFDQSLFVKRAIETLLHEGGMGLFLTALMVLIFLGSLRATVAVSLSIPLSALAAFIALYFGGSSVNTMILAGLALAFSRLIDNSVIVLENIFRHLEMGEPPGVAAERGGQEVSMAVLAATLATAVVFFPVTFLYGVSRFLFSALALAVVLSLFASYVVAMTVVPLFCSRFIKSPHELEGIETSELTAVTGPAKTSTRRFNDWFNRAFVRMLVWYERQVRSALVRPVVVVAAITCFFLLSLLLYPMLGVAFFPRTDAGQFVFSVKAPSGSRLEVTNDEVKRIEGIVRETVPPEELAIIVANIGIVPDFSAIYTSNSGPDTATVQVALKEGHRVGSFEYMERIRRRIRQDMPEVTVFGQSGSMVDAILNLGKPAPIDVQVSGSNLENVHQLATMLAGRIRQLPGVSESFIPQDMEYPAMRLVVDRQRASQMGLSQREVINNVITALTSNGMIAPSYWIDPKTGNDYMLTVQYPEKAVGDVADLQAIPLRGPRATIPVNLSEISSLERVNSPAEIDHYQIQRAMDIYVTPSGEDLGKVAQGIDRILATTPVPPGVRVNLRGMVEGMQASFRSFGLGLLLATLLIYLILVAQFRSLVDPILILLAVPTGLTGALLILYYTGTTLNVQSLMGVVMMVGIVVSNSILIVEFAHRLEATGMGPHEAAIAACRVRLRPILMTSLATIIGLVPLALKLGIGSEAYAPLARAIIGGLLVSVVLTVFIVPAAYVLVYGRKERPPGDGGTMRIRFRFLLMLAAVALLSRRAPAQAAQTLTLKDAETIAVANHPQIKVASLAALAAEQVPKEIRSAYYPTSYGNLTGVKAQTGTRLATGALAASNVYDRYADGLVISQLVTDFGRTAKLSQTAELQAGAQREGIVVTRADVLLGVDQAYFRAMKAQAVLIVAEQTVSQRQLVADRVEALAKAKLKSGLDVSFAEVNLGQAKLLLVQAQNALKAAYADFSLALGFPDQREFVLTEEPLPPAPPPDVTTLLAEALGERPELVRQRLAVQSAHAFELAERDLWFPTISSIANLGIIQVGDTYGKTKVFRPSYAAGGFNVAIPFLNVKLYTARHAEAKFRAQGESQKLQDFENRVAREVRVAWLDAITAYQRLDLTAQILSQATQALDLADARYRLGLSSIVELQQAQLNQTQAAIDQASAKYDYAARAASLNYAVGLLR